MCVDLRMILRNIVCCRFGGAAASPPVSLYSLEAMQQTDGSKHAMAGLMTRAEQAVSATAMARTFGARLKEVTSGDATHLVIFKDNEPAAVLIGVEAYQAMQDELEDLRAERLAAERLLSLKEENSVSLEDMEARFR